MKVRWQHLVLGAGIAAVALQLVPYGRDHLNPPIVAEPLWDAPRTRELAREACFDCHSNETRWPWYASIAPFSWKVQRDVEHGRAVLNFSEWHRPNTSSGKAIDDVQGTAMPPRSYRDLHETSGLDADEKRALSEGLERTLMRADDTRG